MDDKQILNDPWPWFGTMHGRPLAIADLIQRGTLTREQAAALWYAIDRGASVFVAAGPPGAGKSTVANALLEFLPANAHVYVTSGMWDRLNLPRAVGTVYLLINELSCHMPVYLCGAAARHAFALLSSGVRMVGTLHARTAEEALEVISAEASIRRSDLRTPFVFVVVSAHRAPDRINRRVVEVAFLPAHGDLQALNAQTLAAWSEEPPEFIESVLARRAAEIGV